MCAFLFWCWEDLEVSSHGGMVGQFLNLSKLCFCEGRVVVLPVLWAWGTMYIVHKLMNKAGGQEATIIITIYHKGLYDQSVKDGSYTQFCFLEQVFTF